MEARPEAIAIAIAGALLVAWIVAKAVMARGRGGVPVSVRAPLAEAKKQARAAKDPAARAHAWLEAARIVVRAGRPSLAASYAVRAERADPSSVEAVEILEKCLLAARRYKALERFLWRRLREDASPARARALDALIALYAGPLKKRDRARALEKLRGGGAAP
jgi:hypothetical protein